MSAAFVWINVDILCFSYILYSQGCNYCGFHGQLIIHEISSYDKTVACINWRVGYT